MLLKHVAYPPVIRNSLDIKRSGYIETTFAQSVSTTTSQWWRRLVNAYEINACLVCFQCNNSVIHT